MLDLRGMGGERRLLRKSARQYGEKKNRSGHESGSAVTCGAGHAPTLAARIDEDVRIET
jgi:hypothetical protein